MSVLVTGSAGHLGEAVVRRLRAEGRDVRGIDIKASPFTDHVGSITDEAFVRDAMSGATSVIAPLFTLTVWPCFNLRSLPLGNLPVRI